MVIARTLDGTEVNIKRFEDMEWGLELSNKPDRVDYANKINAHNKKGKSYSKIEAIISEDVLTFLMTCIPHEKFDLKHAEAIDEHSSI